MTATPTTERATETERNLAQAVDDARATLDATPTRPTTGAGRPTPRATAPAPQY